MKILAVDTASKSLSVAVSEDYHVIDEVLLNSGLTHSENLMPKIKEVLVKSQIAIDEIDLFAITSGPGSFTGLRIGISTINGFSYALRKKCVGISSLDVLAEMCKAFKGKIVPILNARRGEVYTAIYQSDGKEIRRLSEYQAIPLKELFLNLDSNEKVCFTGEGVLDYSNQLKDFFDERLVLPQGENYHISAGTLAQMAYKNREHGRPQVLPIYLRESEAVVRWKEQHPGEVINGL